MNFRSFKSALLALVAFAAMAFATNASAGDPVSGCGACSSPTSPNLASFGLQVNGGANFGGFAAAVHDAGPDGEGFSFVEKEGGASSALILDVAGGICGTPECTGSDNKFKFNASAWENVKAAAGAKSLVSGVQSAVVNQGGATVGANFSFSRLPAVPATSAP